MPVAAHERNDQLPGRIGALVLRGTIVLLLVTIGGLITITYAYSFASGGKPALEPPIGQPVTQSASSFLDVSTPTPTLTPTPDCGAAWRIVQYPAPGVVNESYFLGLSAITANDIWAVGFYDDINGVGRTLTEHWDGGQWSIVPSPNVPGNDTTLVMVSAVSTHDVWAVGHTLSYIPQTVTMHWDGIQWNLVPSPNMGTGNNYLDRVAAIATNDVWAAGFYDDESGHSRTLTEHWDGAQWSIVPSPSIGTANNNIWSIAAIASDDVWIVGGYGVPASTLTEHWDGGQWSIVPSPNVPNSTESTLYGVSAISSDDVWAVGFANGGYTLTMHWDGNEWNLVSAPKPGYQNDLYGVSAKATNDVWAVGDYFDNNGGHGLTLRWDGKSWQQVSTPQIGQDTQLLQVANLPGTSANVWAVGAYLANGGAFYAIIEHYSDPCITPSPTVTGTPPTNTPTFTRIPTRTRTPTVTGTPPTNTPTITLTPTNTTRPTNTPGLCDPDTNYVITTTMGITMDPRGASIGGACVDCMTTIQLPFPFRLYDQSFTSANVSSNGNIQFASNNPSPDEACLPYAPFSYAIMPFWSQLYTIFPDTGIYTSVTGIAPNRTFDIEWFTDMSPGGTTPASFELRWYENSPTQQFDIIYQDVGQHGANTTIGAQLGPDEAFTQYECNTYGTISYGLELSFSLAPCTTPSTTPSATTTAIIITTGTPTSTASSTFTRGPTTSPTSSPTSCMIQFSDVPQGSTFYPYVHCLACLGIVSGYSDDTFRPGNSVTRGQLSKIVSNSAGFSDNQATQMFQDVPVGSTFFQFIGRLASRGYIGGYPCGGTGESCGPGNLPYFRPNANSTRGQISKIVSNAASFSETPIGQQFQDVPSSSAFYAYIYRLVLHNVMNGYPCGAPPAGQCVPPNNLPYFLPGNNATRGQTSKIVSNTFFTNCTISLK